MDLKDLRTEIDAVDKQIVELYEKRMDIASRVADFKINTGKKVFDKQREDEKLTEIKKLAKSDFHSLCP